MLTNATFDQSCPAITRAFEALREVNPAGILARYWLATRHASVARREAISLN